MTTPKKGITASRVSPEKIQFILDHYGKLTRSEIAIHLNESLRWVKRQIKLLSISGKLQLNHTPPDHFLSESDWTEEIKNRVTILRQQFLKNNSEIVKSLATEFNLNLTSSSLQFWLGKFNIVFWTKQDWMKNNLSKEYIESLINSGLTIAKISSHIKEKFGIYISNDLILVHIKNLGVLSKRWLYFKSFENKANELSKEWIEDNILDRIGVGSLAKKAKTSIKAIKQRLKNDGLKILPRRRVWSQNLETLTALLSNLSPIEGSFPIHEMLLGWLLGDGHIDPTGRFTINHSIKQLGYFYFKVRILKNLITNIATVPRQDKNSFILGSMEQFRLEMNGMSDYLKYLNPDGSKNYEKILSEMTPLSLACYYMDDGSWIGKKVICMDRKIAEKVKNRFFFEDFYGNNLIVKYIDESYIIPSMAYKLPESFNIGSFWKNLIPEIFNPTLNNDLDLSLFNSITSSKGNRLIDIVQYYHKRGFPYYNISHEYLKKQWEDLNSFETKNIWKNNSIIRYTTIGDPIFENFMPHMVEAQHGSFSPLEIFNTYSLLSKSIQYLIDSKLPPLPDFLYKNLTYSNKKVSGFSCAVAKALTDQFCKGSIVIDPCSGWGGRMIGVSSAGRKYYGFEPWEKTYNGLQSISKFLSIDCVIYNKNFNITDAPDECHMILTSPPYIDLETYGNKTSLEEWDSLIKTIFTYADKSLVNQGFLLLNIPEYLTHRIPEFSSLKKRDPVFWNSSARVQKPTETIFIWEKVFDEQKRADSPSGQKSDERL